ncbi:hypothetical protein PVK06_002314 [Gossypium arboreum]|uniref:DUF4283 domain-containing protein n=1 Tax=Gossypium arboreum TaxID=29729 RepID=A0ABR0R4A2_GOSAR|nr:hypothetical protein PVK06_002314 [Gossypium arboreum]
MVPNFSTTQNEIDTQVVWVRLPGLLKGYYSDFLLKAIGQTIGPVLKIDENIVKASLNGQKNKTVKILEGKNIDSAQSKKRNIGESSVVLELSKSKDTISKNIGQEPLPMDVPRSRKPPDVGASRSEHIMVEVMTAMEEIILGIKRGLGHVSMVVEDNILMETINVDDCQDETHMD